MQSQGVAGFESRLGGVVPALRYKDVRAASAWLCNAFGFEEHRLIEDTDGSIRYAQLACGNSMIMLCPVGGSAFDAYMVQPSEADNRETQACYVFVPDALAHKSRALEAGAELVLDIDAGDGRGQGYSCRDLEGHIWSFGTFNPWRTVEEDRQPEPAPRHRRTAMAAAAVITAAIGLMSAYSWLRTERTYSASLAKIEGVLEKPADLETADRLLRQAREDLVRERALRMQAESAGRDAAEAARRETAVVRLAQRLTGSEVRSDADTGGKPVREARIDMPMKALPPAKTDTGSLPVASPTPCKVEASVTPVRLASGSAANDELAALRRAVELAQAQLKEEREQLERERAAREAAERTAREARARVARIEALRRAEYERNAGIQGYRDISREVFPSR